MNIYWSPLDLSKIPLLKISYVYYQMIPCCPVTTNDGYWQASALIRPLVTVTRYMLVIPDTQNKTYFDTYCTYEHVFMHVKCEFTSPLLEIEII